MVLYRTKHPIHASISAIFKSIRFAKILRSCAHTMSFTCKLMTNTVQGDYVTRLNPMINLYAFCFRWRNRHVVIQPQRKTKIFLGTPQTGNLIVKSYAASVLLKYCLLILQIYFNFPRAYQVYIMAIHFSYKYFSIHD